MIRRLGSWVVLGSVDFVNGIICDLVIRWLDDWVFVEEVIECLVGWAIRGLDDWVNEWLSRLKGLWGVNWEMIIM